jgi:hypothetical protein
MTPKLTTFKQVFPQMRMASMWVCMLAIGCTAIHSVAANAPEAPEVSESKKIDLPEDAHVTVLCYQSIYSSGPFIGMPDRSRKNSYIRIVTRGIPGEDACLQLTADGQLRTVPGSVCERPKLADRPCRENP